jgi:hypothetical protein
MKIEEKAKEFAGYDNPSLQGIVTTTARMIGKYDGFKAGAEWMIVKATSWLVKQGLKTNDGVVTICVEDFIKAMEE